MLENAGLTITVCPSDVDEDALKDGFDGGQAPHEDLAFVLADAKSKSVQQKLPLKSRALVIGADQILVCDGKRFDKPISMADAASQLQALQGKTHELISACSIRRGAEDPWRCVDTARLKMRPLSPQAIDRYLDAVGDAALMSVGCYQLEGRGAQLFEQVDGDFFTVLGLPLLPVMAYLRLQKVVPE